MKKIFVLLSFAFLLTGTIRAQGNFEGRIVYAIKVMGENADQMAAFMPESYEYAISGSRLKFKMNGGMTAAMMGEFLVDGDKNETYMIKASEQIAYRMPHDEDESESTPAPTIVKENEVITILGHKCQKYKVTMNGAEGEEATQYMWTTTDIKVQRPKGKMKSGGDIFMDGIDGFPMKIMSSTMGMTMVMTVTEISEESIPASELSIPKGYEIKDFDPGSFLGGMGR